MELDKSSDEPLISQQQSRNLADFGSIKKHISEGGTKIQVTALDAVVNVNSLFSVAVFIGMSINGPQESANPASACVPGENSVKYLFLFEVVAFGFFLFSSLVAHGMKLHIIFSNSNDPEEALAAEINKKFLKLGMIASAMGSVAGTFFLLLSMIIIIQLQLGSLSCGNTWSESAAIPLIILVGSGGITFTSSVFYAALSLPNS